MAKRKQTRLKLSEQVRRAVETCGMTRYAIWKATGVDQAKLSRFASGKTGLTMKALDKLADFLKLDLVMDGKPIE